MKNPHIFLLYGIILVLILGLFGSLMYPPKKEWGPFYVTLDRSICEYYDAKNFECPWDTEKMYKVATYYQDTINGEVRTFAVIIDTLADSHRTVLTKFITEEN